MSLKKEMKALFEGSEINIKFWKKSDEDDYKIIDNDVYVFDPESMLGISLGSMGDGWVCLIEDFFMSTTQERDILRLTRSSHLMK